MAVNCEDDPTEGGVPTTITLETVVPGAVGDAGERSDEQPAHNSVIATPTIAGLKPVITLNPVYKMGEEGNPGRQSRLAYRSSASNLSTSMSSW